MSSETNHAVIATTWDNKTVDKIKGWITELPPDQQGLFAFVPALVNGKTTILLAPDGSKEGWNPAIKTAVTRKAFVQLLKSFDYEDGSSPIDFIEVSYGE